MASKDWAITMRDFAKWKQFGTVVIVVVYMSICQMSYRMSSQIVFNHQKNTLIFETLTPINITNRHQQDIYLKQWVENLKIETLIETKVQSEDVCMKKWLGTPLSILKNPHHKAADENITCSALLFGNVTVDSVYASANTYMRKIKWKKKSDSYFQDNIDDIGCRNFKLSRGYHLKPLDKEEENFPIAFNLIVHKDIDQVEFLLRSIYRPQNSYCIHIDAKCKPDAIQSIRTIASCFDNVFLASQLERVVYAGYSRLQADINCMKDQLNSPIKWKYLINTAGQAMPAKSNLEMVKILKIYNGANDIEGIYGPYHRSRYVNEWKEINIEKHQPSVIKTGKENPQVPFDIEIVKGSAYGIFSRNFTKWMMTDEKAKALLEWCKTTFSPDEHYWATLHHRYSNPHLKPPGAYSGFPNKKPWLAVYVAWNGMDKCYGRWTRSTCLFSIKDLPRLVKRPEFMMNKFDISYEPLAMECLGQWIEYKSHCKPYLDEKFFRSLPFILKP